MTRASETDFLFLALFLLQGERHFNKGHYSKVQDGE